MPEYPFMDVETGDPVDEFFPIADAPEIGSVVEVEGRKLKRLVSRMSKPKITNYAFKGYSLPREDPKNPKWPCDATGVPLFESRAQVKEYAARSEKQAIYDDGV